MNDHAAFLKALRNRKKSFWTVSFPFRVNVSSPLGVVNLPALLNNQMA